MPSVHRLLAVARSVLGPVTPPAPDDVVAPIEPREAGVVMSTARFRALVSDAIDALPESLGRLLDNVVIVVADRHPDEPDVLGLYEGVPLTEREQYGGAFGGTVATPDIITIYREAHLETCRDEAHVAAEVRTTVLHEIAHHFGIDDDRLDELGWA